MHPAAYVLIARVVGNVALVVGIGAQLIEALREGVRRRELRATSTGALSLDTPLAALEAATIVGRTPAVRRRLSNETSVSTN